MDTANYTIVDLLGHCAFCRREVKDPRQLEGAGGVPGAVILEPLDTFDHIWGYLDLDSFSASSSPSSSALLLTTGSVMKYQFLTGELNGLLGIPPMCQTCWEKVQELDKLHKELLLKVEAIKQIINESCKDGIYAWRAEALERKLAKTAGQEEDIKKSTLKFLERLMKSSKGQIESANNTIPKELQENENEPDRTTIKAEITSPPPSPCPSYDNDHYGNDDDHHDEPVNAGYVGRNKANFSDAKATTSRSTRRNTDLKRKRKSTDSDSDQESSHENRNDNTYTSSSDSDFEPSSKKYLPKERSQTRASRSKTEVKTEPDERMLDDNDDDTNDQLQNNNNDNSSNEGTGTGSQTSQEKPDDKNSFFCATCQESFKKEKDFVDHKKIIHNVDNPYRCEHCGKLFNQIRSLQNHEKLHTGERPHKCDYPNCNFRYITKHGLAKHKRTYHKHQRVTCNTCGVECYDSSHLRRHNAKVHQNSKHECQVCNDLLSSTNALKTHMLSKHGKRDSDFLTHQTCSICKEASKKYEVGGEITAHFKEVHGYNDDNDNSSDKQLIPCKQCKHIFPTREDLLQHLYQHREEGIFCDICNDGVKFDKHSKFRQHYVTVHDVGQKYMCEECSKVFSTSVSLFNHKKYKHSGLKSKLHTFPCDECSLAFKSEASLLTHSIKIHGADPLTCDQCAKTFDRQKSLEDHMKLHAGILDFVCDFEGCTKAYPTQHSLAKHKREVHVNGKVVCDTCGRQCYDWKSLKNHIDRVHSEKPICELCGKMLSSKSTLRDHMLIHTGQQPYRCPICDRGFVEKRKMQAHIRIKHDEAKEKEKKKKVSVRSPKKEPVSHVCEDCGEVFQRPERLRTHRMIHTGERPYNCPICNQPFRQKQLMNSHIKLHEKLGDKFIPRGPNIIKKKAKRETFVCYECEATFKCEDNLIAHEIKLHGREVLCCQYCEKTFRKPQSLNDHIKIHTGEKNFACEVEGCDKRYGTAHSLQKHKRDWHKMGKKRAQVNQSKEKVSKPRSVKRKTPTKKRRSMNRDPDPDPLAQASGSSSIDDIDIETTAAVSSLNYF